MKYLQRSFTIAVSDQKRHPGAKLMDDLAANRRRNIASRPHAYVNFGSMCGLCCLAREAKIHQTPEN